MRILVTGANGFVGRYVTADLRAAGHQPLGFDLPASPADAVAADTQAGDLCDAAGLRRLVRDWRPEGCIHLGGIAFVPAGWSDPQRMFTVNLLGTVNLLEAFRHEQPHAAVVIVTSSEVYGRTPGPHPFDETAPFAPANIYAVAKAAADQTALLYARQYALRIMTARPQNHIGPGQSPSFVTSDFARQVAAIAQGRAAPRVRTGNLESLRDFCDVRDVARAYRLLVERGQPGEAYNIAAHHPVTIAAMLRELCRLAGVDPQIETETARYRPTDATPALDTGKLHRHTGWTAAIPLATTLRDLMLEAWPDLPPAPAS